MDIYLRLLFEQADKWNIFPLSNKICSQAFLLGNFDISTSYSSKSIFYLAVIII